MYLTDCARIIDFEETLNVTSCPIGKPAERQRRKASGLTAMAYDSGVADHILQVC